MTEQEKRLIELTEKTKELDSAIKNAQFRMKRARKSLRVCKDACKETNTLIGEINARN